MVVCICKGVRDRDIHAAITEGASTVEQLGKRCGAGKGCGSCHNRLECMLNRKGGDSPGGSGLEVLTEAR
jgi:bacterioferritin-associated ferredoxin